MQAEKYINDLQRVCKTNGENFYNKFISYEDLINDLNHTPGIEYYIHTDANGEREKWCNLIAYFEIKISGADYLKNFFPLGFEDFENKYYLYKIEYNHKEKECIILYRKIENALYVNNSLETNNLNYLIAHKF